MVTTADFPQADRLLQVGDVARAVANGKDSDEAMEEFIGLASEGRQGRYYRRAAEILGLIRTSQNKSTLTDLGREYVALTTNPSRTDFLARCLLETPVFSSALNYILAEQPVERDLKDWFRHTYPGQKNTADRRFATFLSYLRDADLVQNAQGHYRVKRYSGAVVKAAKTIREGLSGKAVEGVYREAMSDSPAGRVIRMEVDAQKMERANQTHWNLITAKAAFLHSRGMPAFENECIDLFSTSGGETIIYEMKSVNEGNLIAQTRKAISQLYEYRFMHSEPTARLCIITNSPIPYAQEWLGPYLQKDRLIAYEWTEDFREFKCGENSRPLLAKFAP